VTLRSSGMASIKNYNATLLVTSSLLEKVKGDGKGQALATQRCLSVSDSWSEALCSLRIGNWLAQANDTTAHYADIHPLESPVKPANIPQPQSATTLSLYPAARKLFISNAAGGRRLSWYEYTVS